MSGRIGMGLLLALFAALPSLMGPLHSTAQLFKTYSVESGLPQSQVYTICQDRFGYLWFGTFGGGVCRFDGIEFRTFTVNEGLSNNAIYSIAEDRSGSLWIGTERGISRYDGFTFRNFSKQELGHDVVNSILQARDGTLWFGTGEGVARFDGSTFTSGIAREVLGETAVMTLFEDRDGTLWMGTRGRGLFRKNGDTFEHVAGVRELGDGTVYIVRQDRSGALWIGTDRGGVTRWQDGRFQRFTNRDGLPDNTVWTIAEDRDGSLWFGTRLGLVQYGSGQFRTFTMADGLSANSVWSLLPDREGNLWIGTDIGGVCRYRDLGFRAYASDMGLTHNDIWAILEDSGGRMWFGKSGGLVRYDRSGFTRIVPQGKPATVFALYEDSRRTLWIGTDGDGVFRIVGARMMQRLRGPPTIEQGTVYSIIEDRNGAFWFATADSGIFRYDGRQFTHFTTRDGLTDNRVYALHEDRSGILWCVTHQGVARFDGRRFTNAFPGGFSDDEITLAVAEEPSGHLWFGTEKGIYHYDGTDLKGLDERDGLGSNVVYFLVFDTLGALWIGHNRGVDRFDVRRWEQTGETRFRPYGADEGFTGVECNQNAAWCDRRGALWFGTIKGAFRYIPAPADTLSAPSVRVAGVRLFMQERDLTPYSTRLDASTLLPEDLRLPYYLNHVTLDYVGINLTAPRRVRYRYRLEGFDEDWSRITHERYAVYANLAPGRYTFRVKARSADGAWTSSDMGFTFEVVAPFWKTVWFYVLTALVSVGLLVTVVRLRLRRVNRRAQELMQLNRMLQTHIEEREHAERAVRMSEAKFRSLAELLTASIFVVRGERILYTNPYASVYTGYTPDELSQMKFWEFAHPDHREAVKARGMARMEGRTVPNRYEMKIVTRSGDVRWCDMIVRLVDYEGGPAILGAAVDITDRKRAEEALFQSEAKYRNLFVNSLVGMFKTSLDSGTVIEANDKAREILGYPEGKVRTTDLYVNPGDREVMKQILREQGRVENFETRMRRSDGQIIWVSFSARYFPEDGCLEGVVVDITERKRTEEALLKVRKIESLGILAGGIAHDFNNVLTAILGNLSLAKKHVRDGRLETVLQHLDSAERASMQARGLTQQLLTFSKGGEPVRAPTSLATLLQETTRFALAGSNVKGELELPPDLRTAFIDHGQIGQVIHNLMLNAVQAMPGGGTVHVHADNVSFAADTYEHGMKIKKGQYVRVAIRDEGTGIAAEHLSRIFDPYFTTKEHGSGLGLATAYSIVRNHQGIIYVDSEAGVGSVFTFCLPAADEPEALEGALPEIKHGKGLVLVMDDEVAILKVLDGMLAELGYEVVTTRNGDEALRAHMDQSRSGRPFDAVILDLTIPGGKGGKETVSEILALDPQAYVVVSSGYSNDPIMANFASYGFADVLPKPYTLEDVSRALGKMPRRPAISPGSGTTSHH
jgi:PAS domain S-box-containing protein